ncbi:uncharacterized protein [Amphiura filiformis]|uniref:uncharacterized protein n=1 Tax=Amphiura filiformis TaxID=82378 RepID=UPI003B211D07
MPSKKPKVVTAAVKGLLGPKGPGIPGVPGSNGLQGYVGPKGESGASVKGDAGQHGEKGDIGNPGNIGPMGSKGESGIRGPPGNVGPMGIVGPVGSPGLKGSPGGPKGPPGVPGVKGQKGEIGLGRLSAFSAARSTSFRPSSIGQALPFEQVHTNFGDDFDKVSGRFTCQVPGLYMFTYGIGTYGDNQGVCLYKNDVRINCINRNPANDNQVEVTSNAAVLQLSTGEHVWLWCAVQENKITTLWEHESVIITLLNCTFILVLTNAQQETQSCNSCCQGPAGTQGTPGIPGVPGSNGLQGYVGPKGESGERGDSIKGDAGQRGEKGDIGNPGLNGQDGFRGPPGEVGPLGIAGPVGLAGPVGPPGLRGVQGEIGPMGLAGPMGSPGVAGFKGQKGEQSTGQSRLSAFSAVRITPFTSTADDQAVPFEQVHTNVGDDFDIVSGRFTCQVAGLYLFTYGMGSYPNNPLVCLHKNDVKINCVYRNPVNDIQFEVTSNAAVLQLRTEEQVWLRSEYSGKEIYSSNNKYTTFSGVLLHQI